MASISGRGAKGHHTYTLTLTEASTSATNNISTVNYSFDLKDDSNWFWSSWGTAIKYSIVANGSEIKSGSIPNHTTKNQNIASGSFPVLHNEDGSKTLSFSFSVTDGAGQSYTSGNASESGSMALTTIPRQATITSVSDFTDEDNPSFTFSNPGGFPMDVWLEPNPIGDHLCIRENIPNIGSFTWELSDAEREELRNKCAGKPSCTIRVGLYTHIGGSIYADYEDKTYTMTENEATKPTVTMTATLNNGSLPSTFNGMYIQGKTRLDVNISAQGKYSASILSCSASIGGEVYNYSKPFLSNVLSKDGKVDVIGYAKDSRQFTGFDEQQIEVYSYSKPLVISLDNETAIQCYRSDGNGKRVGNSTSVWVKVKMSYYSLSGKNQCALRWRKKLVNDVWDDSNEEHKWQDLIPKTETTTNEYNGLLTDAVFDLRKSYTVEIIAIDDIGEKDVKTFEIPTQDVALHLGKGGKNVSVGTYCDYSKDYTFYSDWDAYFDKNVSVGENLSVSKNVSVGGNQIADFIVARGTSDIWTYEKWASGKAECWTKISYAVDDLADTKKEVTVNKSFPFTFNSLPTCNLTLANQVNWNHILSSCDFTTSQFTKFSIYRIGSGSTVAVGGTADIRVIGKWK